MNYVGVDDHYLRDEVGTDSNTMPKYKSFLQFDNQEKEEDLSGDGKFINSADSSDAGVRHQAS